MALTEKGKNALNHIFTFYADHIEFTAKELSSKAGENIVAATLNPLINEGYLQKNTKTSPIKYSLSFNAQDLYNTKIPKTFQPYSEVELERQKIMSYQELCSYLTNKYGIVDGNYFCNETYRSVNPKIKRGKEGLYIHHIKENEGIMLSNPNYAIHQPWEWQCGENLVYCNIFEHLLLHMKIVDALDLKYVLENAIVPGLGGVINYILPILIQRYSSSEIIEGINKKFFQDYSYNWLRQETTQRFLRFGIDFVQQAENLCAQLNEEYEKERYEKLVKEKEAMEQKRIANSQTRVEAEKRKQMKIRRKEDGKIFTNTAAVLKFYHCKHDDKLKKACKCNSVWRNYHWEYVEE